AGPVNSPLNEFYPAVSPDATTLYFTRCSSGGCQIYVSHRDSVATDFPDGIPVPSLRIGAAVAARDLDAQPIWVGDHGVSALYFHSTRRAATLTDDEQYDVFVATRDGAAAWDAPFGEPRLVRQISGAATDFAPVPILPQYWLQSRKEVNGDMNL